MKKNYILLVFIQVIFIITASAQFDGETVVFVIGSEAGNDAEVAIEQRMVDMGLYVVIFDDDLITDAEAASADLLLISGTVNSGTAFENMPGLASYDIPVINNEPGLCDELGFSAEGGTGIDEPEGQIEIVDFDHPMAAELGGTVAVSDIAKRLSGGYPEGDVDIVAVSFTTDTLAVIFAYEEGAAMASEDAPAKRVGFFLMNDVADAMTDEGWALFDAAVQWAMGILHPASVFDNKSQNFKTSVYPNPTSGTFELSFVSDYSQMAEIYITDVTGRQVLHSILAANYGMNHFSFDASELKEGLYFYSVSMNNQIASGKILITE